MDETAPTIVLVDGYTDDRKYWVNWLRVAAPEYRVLEADTGAEGFALCLSHRVDCVVMEMTLPDMPGFELLISLIPLAQKPTIPVIILTRLNFPPVARLAKSNGAQAYLVKARATGDQLDVEILKAIATVGGMAKEPLQPFSSF